MKYQVTRSPDKPNKAILELDVELPVSPSGASCLSSDRPHRHKESPFYRDLVAVEGVVLVRPKRYVLEVEKSNFFSWEDVLRGVLYVLNFHLDPEGEMQEALPPVTTETPSSTPAS